MNTQTAVQEAIKLTDANFETEVSQSDVPVLVDFWADWCPPCKVIGPVVEELAADFDGVAKVAKLDIDANPEVASQYGVRSIPTLLYFKDGKVVDRVIGVVPKEELADKFSALLEKTKVAAKIS